MCALCLKEYTTKLTKPELTKAGMELIFAAQSAYEVEHIVSTYAELLLELTKGKKK